MDKWKKVLWKFLFPKTIWVFLLVNIAVFLLVYALCSGQCPEVLAYFSYALSTYALVTVCVRIPRIVRKVRRGLYGNRYTRQVLTEKELRIRMSLYGGLAVNVCFAIFKVVMGAMFRSSWLYAMAGYNVILSVMRFILVYRDQTIQKIEDEQEKRRKGLHSYHVCGWLMLLLNSAISVIVMIVVIKGQQIAYPGFMIYAIAAFTFYCLTMAIINMVKYWHRHNPIFSAVKRLAMAKALVSIFTLQVAMLTQFGSDDAFMNRMMNALTGISVCVVITVMAVLMLLEVRKDYQELQINNSSTFPQQDANIS